MARYVLRRLVYTVPTLLAVALLCFLMLKAVPGDPAELAAGRDADQATVEAMRRELGLDQPLPLQFVAYLGGIVHGDFGRSFVTRRPVVEEVARRYPRTLSLALFGITFALLLGLTLGVLSAVRPYSLVDNASMLLAVAGISLPSFWLGLMLIYLFGVQL